MPIHTPPAQAEGQKGKTAIRPAELKDWPALWTMIEPVVRAGETYALDRDMREGEARAYWLAPEKKTFVAQQDDLILGTYYLHPNQRGGGRCVANCGYITAPSARGRGIARHMALDSLARAQADGFRAMQFNFVVSTNAAAVHLWLSLGFETLARLPDAFDHPILGAVDALVMYRRL